MSILRKRPMVLLAVPLVVLLASVVATPSSRAGEEVGAGVAGAVIPLEIARIYIEYNSTDNDLGFHVLLDGEDWTEIQIVDPNGITIFEVTGLAAYEDLGLTELFFEGAEPSLEDVPLEELLALFPEGDYQFLGTTVDGLEIAGVGTLTHAIPDGPEITWPRRGKKLDREDVVIKWKPVTTPAGIKITGYEVIVGDSSLKVPASRHRVTVPPEILKGHSRYDIEVLAIEAGGNQTIMTSFFRTE